MMSVHEAASVLAARASGPDAVFTGVSTDTRTVEAGDLFVALRGDRFDGHAFVAQARAGGAVAAMVDSKGAAADAELPTLTVDDTRLALGRLAAHWRARFSMPLVALTGSSGKTTVKEMLAAILRVAAADDRAVLATRGNLNNDIGVPLMLLELNEHHRFAVIETGMNHAGEIRYLTKLASPQVALVNNAGRAHIEYLGSEEAIARAKGEIFEGLDAGGTAVINGDDRFAPLWRELARGRRQVEFGIDAPREVTATFVQHPSHSDIDLKTPAGSAQARLHAPGLHNVRNALAAAAAAVALGISIEEIAAGLESYRGVKGRLQAKIARAGAQVIDDTYNANPESMRAAMSVLAQSRARRIFVMGDMGELGSRAGEYHEELGRFAKELGLERLLAVGPQSLLAVKAFGAGARHYDDVDALVQDLERELAPDVTVLVKGSRFMRMERVVSAIAAQDAGAATCC